MTTQEQAAQAIQECDIQVRPNSSSEGEVHGADKDMCMAAPGIKLKDKASGNRGTTKSSVVTSSDDGYSSHPPRGTKLAKTVTFRDQDSETRTENSEIYYGSKKETEESREEALDWRIKDEIINFPQTENLDTSDEETNVSKNGSASNNYDDASAAHCSRRPKVKRRMSSTIRRLQETIREAQLKDSGGSIGNPQENHQANDKDIIPTSSMAVRVRAIRDARRQRSKSRTRFGKMKYDEIQRPYRRWLGVSTCSCNSFDTRFILGNKCQTQKVMRAVEEDDGFEDMDSPITDGMPGIQEKQERKPCKAYELLAENEIGDNYLNQESAVHKNTTADTVHEYYTDRQTEDGASFIVHRSRQPSPTKSRHRNSVKYIRFESPSTDNEEPFPAEGAGDQYDKMQQKMVETEAKSEIDEKDFGREENISHDPFPLDSTTTGDVSGIANKDDKLLQALDEHERLPSLPTAREEPDVFRGRSMFQSPLCLRLHDQPSDARIISRRDDGGQARKTTSTNSAQQLEEPSTFTTVVHERKPEAYKHEGLNNMFVKQKKSTIKNLITKFRGLHEKAHYITVRAVVDSDGKLPGQLKFKKGQIIKQLATGDSTRSGTSSGSGTTTTYAAATATADGLQYGYYRVGKLRRKVDGIFPSSHVTSKLDSGGDGDSDDNGGCTHVGSAPIVKGNTGRDSAKKKRKK